MLIDSHSHTSDERFDCDRREVLDRAFSGGLKYIIEVGCEPRMWDKVRELAKENKIFSMFGLHPQDASKFSEELFLQLKSFVSDARCVAVGEIGLDYHYELSPKDIQKEVFIKQLNLALEINKPVCIHCRSAYEDMLSILNGMKKLPKGAVHCFSGSLEEAKIVSDMGFLIGVDGPCTYPKSNKLAKVIENLPIEKLLVETDCPYLAPQAYRGQRNEPYYVVEVAKKIAEIKNMSFDDVCAATTLNAIKLYGLER